MRRRRFLSRRQGEQVVGIDAISPGLHVLRAVRGLANAKICHIAAGIARVCFTALFDVLDPFRAGRVVLLTSGRIVALEALDVRVVGTTRGHPHMRDQDVHGQCPRPAAFFAGRTSL